MPTRRTPLHRRQRAVIDAETVRLFAELEAVPMRHRGSAEFKQRDRELHARLSLNYEHFCMVCSVVDDEREPCHPRGYARNDAWHRVREVRKQLLEMAGRRDEGPAEHRQPTINGHA
jgi:hypothetical protein